jgi:hypothetical protein
MKIAHAFLASAVAFAGVAAYAQSPEDPWTVNVPFNFTMRHVNLEAGKYTVRQSGPVVIMTSQNGKTANVLTNKEYSAKPAKYSSLVFNVNGGQYDLAQIKNAGSETELDAVVSKHAPKQLEASTSPEFVEVVALGTR